MDDSGTIYRKTAHGTESLATRHGALAPRQRSLLILVDGRRSHQELAALGAAWGNPEELLAGLLEQGLIEAVSAPPAPVTPTAPVSAPVQLGVPLAQAKRDATRRLTELLGPAGEALCIRLEAAQTPEEFRVTLGRVEGILREAAGQKAAAQFMQEIGRQRPA